MTGGRRPGRAIASTLVASAVLMNSQAASADVPGVGLVKEAVGGTVGWGFEGVAGGIAKWVLGAVADLIDGVVNFLKTSARPDLDAAWFSGPESPFALVRNIAAVLLVAFVFLAVIQGLMAGELGVLSGRIARDVCLAVLGMGATVVVTVKLLDLTDALSTAVLGGADGQALGFLTGFGVAAHSASGGFSSVLIGIVAVVAALLVWIELLVRSALVYLLVALTPLAFAAMTWPAARGVLRKTIEVLVAIIVSKFVVCVAIAVGVAALAGAGEPAPGVGVGTGAAMGLGKLLTGASILAMAAFSPFLVLKLIPLAEAALVAQGISRSPARGAQGTMQTAYYANSLSRLAGRGGGAGTGGTSGSTANGTNGSPSGGDVDRLAGGGASSGGAAASGATAGSAGAGAAGAGTAGAAAAGPAAPAALAAQAGASALNKAKRTVEDSASEAGGDAPNRPRRPSDRDDLAGPGSQADGGGRAKP